MNPSFRQVLKTPLVAFFSGLVVTATACLAAPSPADVVVIGHDQVTAVFAKGGPLLMNSSYKIQAGHRDAAGQVEIHTTDTDIFYIVAGGATIITGGQAVDAKETAPGEWRAEKSIGGTSHQVVKGDVIVIPAGVPHWMPEVTKPFDYFVVKVTGPVAAK